MELQSGRMTWTEQKSKEAKAIDDYGARVHGIEPEAFIQNGIYYHYNFYDSTTPERVLHLAVILTPQDKNEI